MNEPKIRFKGFEGEWEKVTLENICSKSNCLHTESSLGNNSGEYPIFGASGYLQNISTFDYSVPYIGIIKDGSGVGRCQLYPAYSSLLGTMQYILPKKGTNIYFLASLFATIDFSMYVTGSSIPHIYFKDYCSEEVRIPIIEEQVAIGKYFTALDRQITLETQRLDKLKQVKAACLQSMFPQEGETTPRVRFKGFEGEWEKVVIGDIGFCFSGLTGKTKDDFGKGNALYITFLNVLTNAKIDTSILDAVNVGCDEHQNMVKKGDLLFNTSSETPDEVGMCSVMDEDIDNIYLNSFCFGLRITDENIEPACIVYLMRSHIGRSIMSFLAQGATRYNLSQNNFCRVALLLPKAKAEQQAIASYFTALDRQITLETQRLEKLKQIKAACLDKMFV